MIKTFYKKRPPKKIFFTTDMKIKSYAYGMDVYLDFVSWRRDFSARWNKLNINYVLNERPEVGANPAKTDAIERPKLAEPKPGSSIVKKPGHLSPLWFEKNHIEASREGDLFINGKRSDIILGREIKAWGVSSVIENGLPVYTLFVIGKDKGDEITLRAYPYDLKEGLKNEIIMSVPLDPTLNKKSYLYCFGKHIFAIHESKLHYYYYNREKMQLEEVAVGSDEPNSEKDFMTGVSQPVICDEGGSVHWVANGEVYSFPIGFPRKLNSTNLGEKNEIVGIQCFKNKLYIYRRNKITRDYSCLEYVLNSRFEYEGRVFNHGARTNIFYSEKSGMMYYLKIPFPMRRAIITRNSFGNETTLGEIDITAADELFYSNGGLYLGTSYVSFAQNNLFNT